MSLSLQSGNTDASPKRLNVVSLLYKFRDIFDLEDAQTSLTLLRTTMGVCQVNYFIRTVPETATKRGAQRYDE